MWPFPPNALKLTNKIVGAKTEMDAFKASKRLARSKASGEAVPILSNILRTAFAPACHRAANALSQIGTPDAMDEILQALPEAAIGLAEVLIRCLSSKNMESDMMRMNIYLSDEGSICGLKLGQEPAFSTSSIRIRLSLNSNYQTVLYRNGRAVGTSYTPGDRIKVDSYKMWGADSKQMSLADLTPIQVRGLYWEMEGKRGILWGGYKVDWQELRNHCRELVVKGFSV